LAARGCMFQLSTLPKFAITQFPDSALISIAICQPWRMGKNEGVLVEDTQDGPSRLNLLKRLTQTFGLSYCRRTSLGTG
jgi:hypothetical protein